MTTDSKPTTIDDIDAIRRTVDGLSNNKIVCKAGPVVAAFTSPGDRERARWAAVAATEAYAFRMGIADAASISENSNGEIDMSRNAERDRMPHDVNQVLAWIEEAILIPPTAKGTVALAKDARAMIMALDGEVVRLTAALAEAKRLGLKACDHGEHDADCGLKYGCNPDTYADLRAALEAL